MNLFATSLNNQIKKAEALKQTPAMKSLVSALKGLKKVSTDE